MDAPTIFTKPPAAQDQLRCGSQPTNARPIVRPAASLELEVPGDPERLIVTPEPITDLRPNKAARFLVWLESTGDFIVRSDQPVTDGARELLSRGHHPAVLLTLRHQGKGFDSFAPLPIGQWAQWTYSESEEHPLKRRVWVPREVPVAVDREGQKSGSSLRPGPIGPLQDGRP